MTVTERISRVERTNLRWRWAAFGMAIAVAAMLSCSPDDADTSRLPQNQASGENANAVASVEPGDPEEPISPPPPAASEPVRVEKSPPETTHEEELTEVETIIEEYASCLEDSPPPPAFENFFFPYSGEFILEAATVALSGSTATIKAVTKEPEIPRSIVCRFFCLSQGLDERSFKIILSLADDVNGVSSDEFVVNSLDRSRDSGAERVHVFAGNMKDRRVNLDAILDRYIAIQLVEPDKGPVSNALWVKFPKVETSPKEDSDKQEVGEDRPRKGNESKESAANDERTRPEATGKPKETTERRGVAVNSDEFEPYTEERAIAEIRRINGEVQLGTDKRAVRVAVRRAHTFGSPRKLLSLDLRCLQPLDNLQRLDLSWTRFSDVGLAPIRGLEKLHYLNLNGTTIDDAAMENLKRLTNLEFLYLGDTQIGDAGLECLKRLTNLERLDLSNTRVTDDGLEHIKALVNLLFLDLSNTTVTSTGLSHINKLPKLEYLVLTDTRISDLTPLQNLPSLKGVRLEHKREADSEIVELARVCPDLSIGGQNRDLAPQAAKLLATEEERLREQEADDAEKRRQEAFEAARWRTWKTEDGKFHIRAKFVKYISGKLTLEKTDGTTIEVTLDLLCSEDQDFVKNWRPPKPLPRKPPPPKDHRNEKDAGDRRSRYQDDIHDFFDF